jgi:hypothetical protein
LRIADILEPLRRPRQHKVLFPARGVSRLGRQTPILCGGHNLRTLTRETCIPAACRIPDAFDRYLRLYDLLPNPRFANIPSLLREGFTLGISPLRAGDTSFLPPNRASNQAEAEIIKQKVAELAQKGRIVGPFPLVDLEREVAPVQSSPLRVVPKTAFADGRPRWRLVENASFPYERLPNGVESVNGSIDIADFPCVFPSFADVAAFFRRFRPLPHVQFLSLDIEDAFEHLPVHPSVRHRLVLRLGDEGFIRRVAPFGLRSTPSEFNRVMDATIAILHAHFAPHVSAIAYADDTSIAVDSRFVSEDAVAALFAELGWRINSAKTEHFTRAPSHIGCIWDVEQQVVSIKEDKRFKYIRKLEAAAAHEKRREVTLHEVESLIGSLQYICRVRPAWRPKLRRFYLFRGGFKNELALHSFGDSTLRDINWFCSRLREGPIAASFAEAPSPAKIFAASDASNEAMGVYLQREQDPVPLVAAYKLRLGWRAAAKENYIGTAEAWAVEALLESVVRLGTRNASVVLLCDNTNVIDAFARGWSRNALLNLSISRILAVSAAVNLDVSIQYIRSEDNPADAVSRLIPVPGTAPLPASATAVAPFGAEGGESEDTAVSEWMRTLFADYESSEQAILQ